MHEIILFFTGIFVGGMNAIAGGGMLIGFPVLLAVGLPPLVADVTTNLVVLPGQLSSAIGYRRFLRRVPRAYMLLIVPCILGAAIGNHILRHTSGQQFGKIVPALIIMAVVLFIFQPFLQHQIHRHLHGPTKHRRALQPLVIIGLAVLPLSIYGGYFGAGFGFVMLALLGFSQLHDVHQLNGLKNIMGVCIAGTGLITLHSTGLIDWRMGLIMGTGNFIGGYSGAMLAQRVSSHYLRIFIIIIGSCTATYLALRTY